MLSNKAQGALEVLLIISAAVIVAAAVGLYLKSLSKEQLANKLKKELNQATENMQQA